MKRNTRYWLVGGLIAALLAVAPVGSLRAGCGECDGEGGKHKAHHTQGAKAGEQCPHHGSEKHGGGKMCPLQVKGADVQVKKVPDGVIIHITSTDKAVIEEILAASEQSQKEPRACCSGKKEKQGKKSGMKSKALYVCPMGCAKSHKPGKCPKCGMKLKKQ